MSRTNKTKELLAQSLTELMVTTPLEKISVNDIVEHAGVGRNTFYYHFEDKFDLVNWYFQSGATQFLVTRGHYASWSTLLTDLEEYLLQNKTFYVNALAYTGQNCLQEYPLLKRDVWPAATLAGAKRNRARLPVYRQLFIGRHDGPFAALGTQWHAAAEPS